MKKLFLLIFLILLSFQFVSAVEVTMKESFQQGETILAKVSGNFLTSITRENVFFYKEFFKIPIDYTLEKISGEYYIYALSYGKSPGNYSLSIEGVRYMSGAEAVEDDIVKNFTITNETAPFSVNPGAVMASEDFYVEVRNLKEKQITVNVKAETSSSARDILVSSEGVTAKEMPISIKSGEVKKVYFILGTGNPSLQNIGFSFENFSYSLPVYISTSLEETAETITFEPSELILSLPTDTITKRAIYIYNTGSSEIKNISLSLSGDAIAFTTLTQTSIDKISAGSNFPIELSFFSPGETEISGILKADINGEKILYSQISLKFLDNYVPVNESSQSDKTCAELNGRICSSDEVCSQMTIYAKDNVCCPGVCETAKKSSSGVIIGILIFVVLIIGGIWFYKKKYNGAKKPVDLLKEAKPKKLVSFWAKK
jgi:hypothetical protein